MAISNYGFFKDGISIGGLPLAVTHPGKVYFVDSVTGSDGNSGKTREKPFATLAYALSSGSAVAAGDVVFMLPTHTETISAAGTITAKAGVACIGMGWGNTRPTFTWSATASTFALSAAGFILSNVRTLVSIDAVAVMFPVTAAGVVLDKVDYYLTSAKSPITFINTTTAGTDLTIKNCEGFQIAAVSVTKWIDLIGADRFKITDNNWHINATTHIIGGTTTASLTGVLARNTLQNPANAASIVMLAATTGIAIDNRCAGGKTAVAGTIALASMQGSENYATHTANKNGLLDPVVDT